MRRVVASVLLALVVACAKKPTTAIPTAPPGGVLVAFRKHIVAAEVAAAPAEWQRGLMARKHLGANAGMLFLFPTPQRLGFWMKDTLIPLQIAFLKRTHDQTYRIVRLIEMTPCHADPCHIYDPGVSYDAALEVNSRWFGVHNVHVGSTGQVGRAPTPKS